VRSISTGHTDIGRSRKHNEDSFLCDDAIGLYVVADGVGGHAKGEVASAESVAQIQNWVQGARDARRAYLEDPDTEDNRYALRRTLESAVQQACYMVFGMAEMNPDQRGMSTTISALMVLAGRAFIAQVGDSRVYLLRGSANALQLTEDHTLINYKLKQGLITPEQAKLAKGKNVITRAVGHKEYVEVDNTQVDLVDGDRLLLCSDGLHGYLLDDELAGLIAGKDAAEACKGLIDLANQRGGKDNITVVIVEMVADGADALLGR
jgi:serine/threonine protein phosphatase PrpC